ncbi:MAG: hypothetical protein U5N86_08440 [Planctomycetota bacterium]|nr:hypothetical protein [Planctomycetota bacterium]
MTSLARIALATFALLLVCTFAAADVVFFVDGERKPVEGKVTEKDGKVFVETSDGGELEFDSADVARIVRGKGLDDLYAERLDAVDGGDLDALYMLALWCDRVGLVGRKAQLMVEILRRDPDHAGVHTYLGHVYVRGKWINPRGGEQFGDEIDNTLGKGKFTEVDGERFLVRTDTSKEFGELCSQHVEYLFTAVQDALGEAVEFRKNPEHPQLIILQDYEEYFEKYREAAALCPDADFAQDGPPVPRRSCFLHPRKGYLVTYRFEGKRGEVPFRAILQKMTGLAIYYHYMGPSKPDRPNRGFAEGFGCLIQNSYVRPDGALSFSYVPQQWKEVLRGSAVNPELVFSSGHKGLFGPRWRDIALQSYALHRYMMYAAGGTYGADYVRAVKADLNVGLSFDKIMPSDKKMGQLLEAWDRYVRSGLAE